MPPRRRTSMRQPKGDAGLVHDVEDHLGNAKLHESLVRNDKSLLKTESIHYAGQLLASTGTEVRYFVEDKPVNHNAVE